jgi:uncharacterized iron-regulated protein
MYEDRKQQALDRWYKLLAHPEIHINAEKQYEEMLRLAEDYLNQGFINHQERQQLKIEAANRFRTAIDGLDGLDG